MGVSAANDSTKICFECIADHYLSLEVEKEYVQSHCYSCGSENNQAISINDLADLVHEVLQSHFYLTSESPEGYDYYRAKEGLWERDGVDVASLISDIVGVTEDIAGDIVEELSDCHDDKGKAVFCSTQLYSFDPHYEENSPDHVEFTESWRAFKLSVGKEARFFNEHAKGILEHLFKGVDKIITHHKDPVIRNISIETKFFRSRIAKSQSELGSILKELPSSIGPPGSEFSRSGRMNAHGISVFYGALDKETCLAEVRAPVGAHVVTGVFNPLRALRILDLSRFESIGISEGSYFDEEHMRNVARQFFLKSLTAELSEPIMPGDEERRYLATQVVADYLATNKSLKLDGLIFNSSQISLEGLANPEDEGKNIVLFYQASRLSDKSYSDGKEFDIDFGWEHEGDSDLSVTLLEKNISKKESNIIDSDIIYEEITAPTIALNMSSIEVDRIKSISINIERRNFNRVEDTGESFGF
mgnify:CR=1 FL=1